MRSRQDGTCIQERQCIESKLGVTAVTKSHVTAAVSCCLEMALWRTLWMVDQVSLTAIGGLSASRNKKLMNFLACGPGRPVVSRMNGTRLMCGYLSNLVFSALLAICPGFVLAAETRDGLQEKGATIETSKYVTDPLRLKTRSIRACSVCPLTTRVRAGTSYSINTLTPLCD